MGKRVAAAAFLTSLCALAGAARAQESYVPIGRTISTREEVDNDLARARLRLGPVRLIPSVAVTNAGYDSNVFGTTEAVGDWTATFAAGFRFLVPLGPKMYLRADAFPQYTWYNELTDRRFFGGVYRGSLLGFFNRMTLELIGESVETYRTFSSELDTRVVDKTQAARANVEVEISGPIFAYAHGDYSRSRYDQEGVPQDVARNDNDHWAAGGGVRYRPSASWAFSLGYDQGWTEFLTTGTLRDNQTRSALVGLQYGRPRLFVNLSGGYREGRAANGSEFPEYSTGVGSGFISFFPIRWLELRAFGLRGIGYSLSTTNPYYFENRIGGGVNIEVLGRFLLRGFGEFGPNNYPLPEIVDGEPIDRRDEARLYGGGISVKIIRNIVLSGSVSRTVYESNVPGVGRDYLRYIAGLSFGGEYVR